MQHRLRFLIVLSTFLLSVLLYVDRVCISAAKDAVALDLSLSDLQMGWVFSAFSLGYALLQAPGGWIADRLGPRRVLAIIVSVWSVFTGLTAVAGFILAAVGILGSAFAETPVTSSIWFSLCIFGADMTLSPSWSACVDIGRSNSGVVSGTMNMAGNAGAFVTSLAFPYLLSWTDSSMPFFYIASGMNLMAVMMWLTIDPTVALKDQT